MLSFNADELHQCPDERLRDAVTSFAAAFEEAFSRAATVAGTQPSILALQAE
jgi:hypothetical protein